MRSAARRSGSALVWMVLVLLVLVSATFGMIRFGTATGDYVRRQATADAAVRSAAAVLAERLRHIGRIQGELQGNDEERAELAWTIARGTPESVSDAARRIASENGARSGDVIGIADWFVEAPEAGTPWVGLAPGFPERRLTVVIHQRDAWGIERRAEATAWVRTGEEWPVERPVRSFDWTARLADGGRP